VGVGVEELWKEVPFGGGVGGKVEDMMGRDERMATLDGVTLATYLGALM